MDFGGNSNLIPNLLSQLVYEENILRRLRAINTLSQAVDDDIAKLLDIPTFLKTLNKNYLKNVEFLRRLKLYSKINDNIETAIEYHSTDYITHQEYVFDEQFEAQVEELSSFIDKMVGLLLKEYSKGESIEF